MEEGKRQNEGCVTDELYHLLTRLVSACHNLNILPLLPLIILPQLTSLNARCNSPEFYHMHLTG